MFNDFYSPEKVYMVTWFKNDIFAGRAYFEKEEDAVAYRREKWHKAFDVALEIVTIHREDD